MEDELKRKFQCNWSRLKDELSASSGAIADVALQNNILDFDELETIASYPSIEKVCNILLKVVKRNKCDMFLNAIEKKGFGQLCKAVRNTDIEFEPIERSRTYLVGVMKKGADPDMSVREMWSKMEQKFEEARLNQIEGNTKLEQKIGEIEERAKTDKAEADSKYDTLQSAYQYTKDEINRLTSLNKEKTWENAELLKEIETLKDGVKETKHIPSKDIEGIQKDIEYLQDKLKQSIEIQFSSDTAENLV